MCSDQIPPGKEARLGKLIARFEITVLNRRENLGRTGQDAGTGKPAPLLQATGLSRTYRLGAAAVPAVQDVSLSIDGGRFGFVFQTFNLIPVLSAEENVAYPMVIAGVPDPERRQRAGELLRSVGLGDKAGVRPDLLSGGQRQRVAIARALANRPAIVFADEPTANLDSHTAEEILDLMRSINDTSRVAFLLATHDPRVVARARRVILLRDGRVEKDSAS